MGEGCLRSRGELQWTMAASSNVLFEHLTVEITCMMHQDQEERCSFPLTSVNKLSEVFSEARSIGSDEVDRCLENTDTERQYCVNLDVQASLMLTAC